MSVIPFPAGEQVKRSDGPDARAVAGAAGAPLSNEQKRDLAMAAQAAWQVQTRLGLWAPADGDADAFRHAAAFDACGLASFRAMTQRHFLPVLGYFRTLAGGEARRLLAHAALDDTRRALAKLQDECAACASEFGDDAGAWAYAQVLLRKIHKATPVTATPRQVWQVLFTLRNRAAAIRRKRPQMPLDGVGASGAALGVATPETRFAGFRGALAGANGARHETD